MLSIFPACFFHEDNHEYSVVFPDLNYLSTCGKTLEEAMDMAIDCLAGYLYTSKQDEDDIPTPSPLEQIDIKHIAKTLDLDIEKNHAFVNYVSVDVDLYAKENFEKSVKKTLTIPAWLNRAAQEKNINFSQTLQEALVQKLQIHKFSKPNA